MDAQEFRDVLDHLGMSQTGCGKFLGVNGVTVRRWALGEGPPNPAAILLRLMVAHKLSPAAVDEWLGAYARPAPRQGKARASAPEPAEGDAEA